MKTKFRINMTRAFALLLTAFFVLPGVTDAVEYDPNTIVYIDALWCRAHAADCPDLILKEHKQTMTLGEADQLGYRIGESGQSGRTDCCLHGYTRQHPLAVIEEDAMGVVQTMSDGDHKYHVHGCHRFTPDLQDHRMTLADARGEKGFYLCEHCIERGPGFAQMSDEEWNKLPSGLPWNPPAGWAPSSFPADTLPPQEEIDILLSQALHGDNIGILDRVFINPVATVDNFVIMRFFFPVERWLELYQAYRCTGDTGLLELMRGSARHYNTMSKNYLSAAQYKARDPEGMAYMYTMAASARITLQLARKYPAHVTTEELAEAEDFLMTIISVLEPVCEGNDNLDWQMGIPKPLADDFRNRAFNRALNGIGTLGMATAALQDLQVLNSTTAYQPTIDRCRKVIQEYIKNWKNTGFEETVDGKDYFSYPYSATDSGYWVGDVKLFGADDQGHFSHSMQGCYVLYDSVPELGVDDAFMTALANTIEFNSYTTSGSPQTPSQEAIRPHSRYPYGAPRDRFYLLQAFNDGVIAGQCNKLSASAKESTNSEYEYRRATLNAQYLKAIREERGLIYLGDQVAVPPATPTGLAAIASNAVVTLTWTDGGAGVASYNVYRSLVPDAGYSAIQTNLSVSAYADHAVTNGTIYFYKISAVGTNDLQSQKSEYVAATPADPDNQAPSFSGSTIVETNAMEGADYSATLADHASDPEGDAMTFLKTDGPDWLTVATSGILSGTPDSTDIGTNTFGIRVLGAGGSDTAELQILVETNPALPPAAPIGLKTLAGNSQVSLIWNANSESDLAGYNVYRSMTTSNYTAALTNGLTSTNFVDATVVNGTTYYYVVTATDTNRNESAKSSEVSARPTSVPVPDVLHWTFDQGSGSTAVDSTGNSRDGTISGASWSTDTPDGSTYALSFSIGDMVEDVDAENYLNGLSSVTLSMWVKSDMTATDSGFVLTDTPTGHDDRLGARYDKDGLSGGGSQVIKASISTTGGDVSLESAGNVQTTSWQHFVLSWSDGNPLKLYIDGVETVYTHSPAALSGTINNVTTLMVGKGAKDASGGWSGLIDNVQIFSRELSAAEVQAVMNSGGGSDIRGYDLWATEWGPDIGAATNDPDADGLSNLSEYALGGDPTNSAVHGSLPVFTKSGNGFIYVHPKRSDSTSITYTVETTTNLMSGVWRNEGFVATGTNVTGGTLDFVTNSFDTADGEKYIRLRVGQ
jgi:hypothetical protein